MRKAAAKKKDEDMHRLIIKGQSNFYFHQKVTVNFAPVCEARGFIHPEMRDMLRPQSILPTFNADKLHFTPSFVLPSQQRDDAASLHKHRCKAEQYEQINQQQILVPKPKDRYFCHSCRSKFEDYYEHINQKRHLVAQKNHSFQKKIKKLCRKFHKQQNFQLKYTKQNYCSEEEESISLNSDKQNHAANCCPEIQV